MIDWSDPEWHRKVPKRALVDALRNSSIGPSNLSMQDKVHLVDLVHRHLCVDIPPDRRAALRHHIEDEAAYQRGHKR